jgi:hypothetical protein
LNREEAEAAVAGVIAEAGVASAVAVEAGVASEEAVEDLEVGINRALPPLLLKLPLSLTPARANSSR